MKQCSHTNSYVQSDFNGPHFLALSSFPPFCQSCHSLSQQREGKRESMLCQLSRVTSAFTLFLGLMAINFHKAQNAMNHTKELAKKHVCAWVHFSHTQSPTYKFTNTHTEAHTHTHSLNPFSQKGRCVFVCACVSWHTGQSDVPSHICQHPLFIYLVILSFVDLVTWSESGRCRGTGPPESPVRTWWETRACDLAHSATHTYIHT